MCQQEYNMGMPDTGNEASAYLRRGGSQLAGMAGAAELILEELVPAVPFSLPASLRL